MKSMSLIIICGAATLGACRSDQQNNERMSAERSSPTSSVDPAQWRTDADARILEFLHMKNQEEIAMGQLARERGASDAVRNYGDMLVRDHGENDVQVVQIARDAGVTLTERAPQGPMSSTDPSMQAADPMAELRGLQGRAFDDTFVRKMADGHREAIATVEAARPNVRSASVRAHLDRTLPALRHHEEMASNLANR